MFISQNRVRMHDTDMAGLLYFARQYRFAHDALEDFMLDSGFDFHEMFHKGEYVFVIVHSEADYKRPVKVGDSLTVHVEVEAIGSTSFTLSYAIYLTGGELMGTVRTVHVTLNSSTRQKIEVPSELKQHLAKHLKKNT
jgi:1,4-dihydroxy-2-naphthoyl-CoA hydrolase